ncbi:hypothetical protein C3497_01740 [Zoogloeaceae bacteirum Par-f-2]|jgi:ABC-type uncharacterized transport system substrate-binding protein|uniref:ABC transporter substrate binding protein n=1 Tax=Pseudothauera hydrothermalis TaxID=2184083 RepID=UPI000C79EEC6|nr:ABC transporter substrate binding protein [Pseudothauera hydrothermalis]AUL99106.1 hypothetical protein B4966_02120 [Rhodocyclaceae bacterium]AVZ78328.1 hypothetical protein C3497_01740 [Zoogloeaceae bacteirum Par-f-2]
MPYLALIRLFVLALAVCAGGQAHAGAAVLLVLGDETDAHQATATAFRLGLPPGTTVEQIDWPALTAERLRNRQLIVSVGGQAARAIAEAAPSAAVVHTLLTRAAFARLPPAPDPSMVTAIFLDQPAARQIALIRLALPEARRLALLAGPSSGELVDELAAAARQQGMEPVRAKVSSDRDLFAALQQVFSEPAVLLATPDPAVFNSYTVQNVLLTAYRHRSPVVGFSPAYARAGAALALYATPEQIGAQAAAAARAVLAGGRLPPPAPAREFEVSVNKNVARSLGIALGDGQTLARALRREEHSR